MPLDLKILQPELSPKRREPISRLPIIAIKGRKYVLRKQSVAQLRDLLELANEELLACTQASLKYTPQQMIDFGNAFMIKYETNVKVLENAIAQRLGRPIPHALPKKKKYQPFKNKTP